MNTPERAIDLSNQFLIAMPGMEDSIFSGTLVLVCEHTDKGALGVVVNRPLELNLGELFHKVDLSLGESPKAHAPVYFGGPVQTGRGFVVHEAGFQYSSTLDVGDMALTTSRDLLEAVARGEGPERFLVTVGYTGWDAGQLEQELASNAWLNVDASATIVFETPAEQRLNSALSLLGIAPHTLAGVAGHA